MSGFRGLAATLALLVLFGAGVAAAQSGTLTAPVRSFEVVARHPHDIDAFTEGLIWHDGNLYEGTGLDGHSELRRVDLTAGDVLAARDLAPNEFGEGIAIFGKKIYQLTWKSQIAYVYDLDTFDAAGSFSYEGEGWGLTTDGTSLIMSNGSDQIAFRDPETFEITRSISVRDGDEPIANLNELEYIDGTIWANVWKTNLIARIDPESGAVIDWLDLSSLAAEVAASGAKIDVLNGIAWDAESETVLVTGKFWPTLFELRLLPPSS